jgi:hypothetical protein
MHFNTKITKIRDIAKKKNRMLEMTIYRTAQLFEPCSKKINDTLKR